MTQIYSTQLFGRAFELRRRATLRRKRKTAEHSDTLFTEIKSVAYTYGAYVIEPNGREVPVQPKWILNILLEGTRGFTFWNRASLFRKLLVRARSRNYIAVHRKLITTLQSYIGERDERPLDLRVV